MKYRTQPSGSDRPPAQRLVTGAGGFPVPSEPASRRDAIHGGPSPIFTRKEAEREAREMIRDDSMAIVLTEAVAQGVRRGNRQCGAFTVDPNLLNGNAKAKPVNIWGKFVVTPQNPTAAQTAAAILLAQANFAPGQNIWPYAEVNHPAGYQVGVVQGRGPTVTYNVAPSEVLVIDTFGITSFSAAAEFELVWNLSLGTVQAGGAAPANTGTTMFDSRRGWPFGVVGAPSELHGESRVAPQQGPDLANVVQVVLHVQHDGDNTNPAVYIPAPHYVEVEIRGWRVPYARDNTPLSSNVGGKVCDPEVDY